MPRIHSHLPSLYCKSPQATVFDPSHSKAGKFFEYNDRLCIGQVMSISLTKEKRASPSLKCFPFSHFWSSRAWLCSEMKEDRTWSGVSERVFITLVGCRVTPLLTSRPPKAAAPGRLPGALGVHFCRLLLPRPQATSLNPQHSYQNQHYQNARSNR